MKNLSNIALGLKGQPMFQLLDRAQKLERIGKDILHFEIGDPDFNTPENIVEAGIKALRNNDTHYTSSSGLYEFKEVIRETTYKSRGFKPEINQILITPGANSIIYFAIKCLVNKGEEVIVPNPGFPTYYSAIKACEAIAIDVPLKEENQFRLSPKDLESRITSKTRLIILNSPNNPTGGVNTPDEIVEIAEIVKKHDIYIISDEIYARMIFDTNFKFASPSYIDFCKERTIILNGFSKAFAMTGWRLGVAIGPSNVIEKMELLLQTIVSCVPPFIQRAGIEAINGDQTTVNLMMQQYKIRRDLLVDGLNSIKNITCIKPEGAIYLFPNIMKTGMTSQEFCDFILDKAGVVLLPGNNFGSYGEGFIRMCYVNGLDNCIKAVNRMKSVLI